MPVVALANGVPMTTDKFASLREHRTNGINCGLTNEDVIARLREWDEAYGITLSDAATDRVMVHLETLPEDMDAFAREVYRFCPDIVDQNFGAFIVFVDDDPEELTERQRELMRDIDFDDEDYGLEIMKRAIVMDRMVGLWWD